MTENGGRHGHRLYFILSCTHQIMVGVALAPVVSSDTYDTDRLKKVPYVETVAVVNDEKKELTVLQSIVH